MNVGNVRVLTFAQAQSGLTIPASKASAVYVVVAANVAGDTGTVPQYTISGDFETQGTQGTQLAQQEVQGPTMRAARSIESPLRPMYTRVGGAFGSTFEEGLRTYERRHLHIPTNPALKQRRSPMLRADYVPAGTVPTVGQRYQFNVPSGNDPCTTFSTVTAQVMKVSTHAILLMDTATINAGFTQATYDSVANEFDTYIYPTEASYYGAPTDIDGNGHVYILYTPVVNLETPDGQAARYGYVGGYTFAGDFFPPTGPPDESCAESNQGEIFYLLAPDPTGHYHNNPFSVSFVEENTRVTMAHELQHAIIDGARFESPVATQFESAWLDEALSSLAEDNVGRVELGYTDLQTLSASDMYHLYQTDSVMFNTFFATNFSRTQLYVQRPDTIGAVVTDNRVESDLAAFGAGWAFVRYVVDWYSNNSPRTLTQALVTGPDTGTANLVQHAGAPLDTLLAHWLVTMYTDNQGISGLPAQYNYKTYNLRDIISDLCSDAQCSNTYLPVHALGNGTNSIMVGIPSTSADYFITSQSTGGARTINIVGQDVTAAVNPFGRLYIIRVQ